MNILFAACRGLANPNNPGQTERSQRLRGIDLTVAPGEVVRWLPRPAAGKSTLLHIRRAADSARRGTVEIGCTDYDGGSPIANAPACGGAMWASRISSSHLRPSFGAGKYRPSTAC